ncbi:response regulator transcription factor [Yimella sp. cx-573]|nr:response regulator transcription factor [Yimella sp. cx-573]
MTTEPVAAVAPSAHSAQIRVAAIDDHPVVLRGIIAVICELAPEVTVDFLVTSVRDIDWTRVAHPDVVLLDIDLNDGSRAEDNVRALTELGLRVLLFTAENRPALLRRLVLAGASGLALKSDREEDLVEAVRQVAAGQFATSGHFAEALLTDPSVLAGLAPREVEVLEQLAAGVPKKAIGKSLPQPVASSTVETYFQRIAARYAALGRPVPNMYGSLREAARDGYLDL